MCCADCLETSPVDLHDTNIPILRLVRPHRRWHKNDVDRNSARRANQRVTDHMVVLLPVHLYRIISIAAIHLDHSLSRIIRSSILYIAVATIITNIIIIIIIMPLLSLDSRVRNIGSLATTASLIASSVAGGSPAAAETAMFHQPPMVPPLTWHWATTTATATTSLWKEEYRL
jgi:hypothetical protein